MGRIILLGLLASMLALGTGYADPDKSVVIGVNAIGRVAPTDTQPLPQPVAEAGAARATLYEEDPANPRGNAFVGLAMWRTQSDVPRPGMPPELKIHADIEIPDRRLVLNWSFYVNPDPALPASHLVELRFSLASPASGAVATVPGLLMKSAEQARGVPLASRSVMVTENVFLIGLSSFAPDMERNIANLKTASWFDIPIIYDDKRRAIIALEKGIAGTRAFAEGFATWRQ